MVSIYANSKCLQWDSTKVTETDATSCHRQEQETVRKNWEHHWFRRSMTV